MYSQSDDRRDDAAGTSFGRALLVLVLVELLLGGNGYLTEIAGIRLRVWLFFVCICWVVFKLDAPHTKPLQIQIWNLLLMFVVVTGVGTAIGVLSGHSGKAILAELKPLLYFALLPYFALAVRNERDIDLVLKLIVVCGVIQALGSIAVMLAVHTGMVPYSAVYEVLAPIDEFIFRGVEYVPSLRSPYSAIYDFNGPIDEYVFSVVEYLPPKRVFLGIFYKGAVHLCIAFLVLVLDPFRRNYWLAGLILAAIAFTITRGLWLSLALSLVYRALFLPRKYKYAVLALLAAGTAAILGTTDVVTLLQRPESDQVRLADLRTIWSEVDARMTLIGKGLGAPIGRRDRIEMTYLEVFYKQGLIGLSLWITLFVVNFNAMMRVHGTLAGRALVLHLAAAFVYLQTATNTFLTGSIGMSIVLISTVSLLVLQQLGSQTSARPRRVG